MPTFEELRQQYMITRTGSGSLSSGSAINIHSNCEVTPLIKGRAYFPALKAAINGVTGSEGFIYITGWWCDSAFSLDSPGGATLVDLLKAKAAAGVDVRILGWVMAPEVLTSRLLRGALSTGSLPAALRGMLTLNDDTMQFILNLRAEPALANKACLNILAHPGGAVHMKFALVGNSTQAVGFTGGIDLKPGRWDNAWHDVQAQVRGPVLQDFFTVFQQQWNEIQGRSVQRLTGLAVTADSHSTSTPTLPNRTLPGGGGSTLHTQSLRTQPQFNFSTVASTVLPTNTPLSYAPSGIFEVKAAWQKAIEAAQRYIYIEDQGFTSAEVFDWINARLRANSELRVVLVTGQPDPNDAPNDVINKAFGVAVNAHLLNGIAAGSPEISRIGIFSHRTNTIHTKMTIIDDQWVIVGSANCMRRSLYTDFEHSVAYMDEQGLAVPTHRANLWAVHLGSSIADVNAGLTAWFAIPFAGAPAGGSTVPLDRLRLPLTSVTLTSQEQVMYDEVMDVDSRQTWGLGLARIFMSSGASVLSVP